LKDADEDDSSRQRNLRTEPDWGEPTPLKSVQLGMPSAPKTRHHRRRRWLIAGLVVVVALIVLRLALPVLVRDAVNRRLARIPDYTGHVDAVELGLWRGAYALRGVEIVKREGGVQQPFFKARRIDFSIAWREVLHRKVVSDIIVEGAELNFVRGRSSAATQLPADRRWQEVINDLFPIDITFLEIRESRLSYLDETNNPKVDVQVAHLSVVATGLRNHPDQDNQEFPARIDIQGETIGHGRLQIATQLEPLALQPHFLLKLQVEQVALPALNDFLRAYGGVDVSAGTFNGYLEMTARNGHFEGYFKPFFQDVDFKDTAGQDKALGEQIWEGAVRFFAFVFKNHRRDQVATRIPFSGEFGHTDVSSWVTFRNLLRHAFVRPWPEKLESRTQPEPAAEPANPAETPATKPPGKS
jgi:hypothetical protein